MGYREVSAHLHSFIELDGDRYDLDCFGMDDGKSESDDDTFRFLFQLGAGYATHLYVIVTGGQGRARRRFYEPHFWLKGYVTIDMEMEEWPAPKIVRAARAAMPLVYSTVTVGEQTRRIVSQHFEAAETQKMELELESGSQLVWTPEAHWRLDGRSVEATERLVFD